MGNTTLLALIKTDLDSFARRLQKYDREEAQIEENRVLVSLRNLGKWRHDEGNEDEEDDDQEVWAPGEYKKYFKMFEDWASIHSWRDKVRLLLDTSEKNWCEFSIILND